MKAKDWAGRVGSIEWLGIGTDDDTRIAGLV